MIRQAFDTLAALPVPNVNTFGIDALPEVLERAHLPALLVLPHEQSAALSGAGLSVDTFGGAHQVTLGLTHLLLWSPARAHSPIRKHIPALIDGVDAVLSALAADPLLGGHLAQPPQMRLEIGVFEYGSAHFLGCAFRHTWLLSVVTA